MRLRPKCNVCGVRYGERTGSKMDGSPKYRGKCSQCHGSGSHKKKKEKGDTCECCGFKATHPCQLDIDHIDGNSSNNSSYNKQTLCANCHRLKTFLNRDWEIKC